MTGSPRPRYRLALTPAGAGVLTLCFPGLLVAVASGQGPLMAVSLGSALVLAGNALWARLSLGPVSMAVWAPTAVTVGAAVALEVTLTGPRRLEAVLGVDGAVRSWAPVPVPGRSEVLWRAPSRGVVEELAVRVQSSVPLGLTAVVRQWVLPLATPIHAAPAAVAGAVPGPGPGAAPPAEELMAGSGSSDPVGLRSFRPGDQGRDIHWATLARTANVMVRDRRGPDQGDELTVEVRSARPDTIDHVAARARGLLEGLLSSGFRVELDTVEAAPGRAEAARRWSRRPHRGRGADAGPGALRVGPVAGRDEVVARLARAVPGYHDGDPGGAGPDDSWGTKLGDPERQAVGPGIHPRPAAGGARMVVDEDGVRWASPA